MARRKRLEAPSSAEIETIRAEVAAAGQGAERRPGPAMPIAHVAAEAAGSLTLSGPEDLADAEELRRARADGRLILALPLDEIEATALVRDRTVIDAAAQEELRDSILRNGVRLPVEVTELAPDSPARRTGARYGLVSGYRRLLAVREIFANTEIPRYATIPALVVEAAASGEAMARMVEENEVRLGLSPFERGRIAVVAAQQGAFASTEEAVSGLFATASKAKRSKIRAFATLFEELGDLLAHGEMMTERQGLRLSAALRDDPGEELRAALDDHHCTSFAEEWAVLEPVIQRIETRSEPAPDRGGRPRKRDRVGRKEVVAGRWTLQPGQDEAGHYIRIDGEGIGQHDIERLIGGLRTLIEARQI